MVDEDTGQVDTFAFDQPRPLGTEPKGGKVAMSVVIPAFNEEDRIGEMLVDCVKYLQETYSSGQETWEILVVNDGSTDATTSTVLEWARAHRVSAHVRVCELVSNRGKGGAVKHVCIEQRNKWGPD